MNIIDAVKSGRRFRRKRWDFVVDIGNFSSINNEDILATDWEIEERKIEITESEFDAMCNEVMKTDGISTILYALKRRLFEK